MAGSLSLLTKAFSAQLGAVLGVLRVPADAAELSWSGCLNFYETDNTTSIIGASQHAAAVADGQQPLQDARMQEGRTTLSAFTAAARQKDIRYCFLFRLFSPFFAGPVCGPRSLRFFAD